jgi:hypothetical protein
LCKIDVAVDHWNAAIDGQCFHSRISRNYNRGQMCVVGDDHFMGITVILYSGNDTSPRPFRKKRV